MDRTDRLKPEQSQKIYLGLGSNIQPSLDYMRKGCRLLSEHLKFMQISSIYQTTPVGYKDQADFLNCAVSGFTDKDPRQWLDIVHEVEDACNRIRDGVPQKGPRTLDVDILFWQGGAWSEPDLIVPHAELTNRRFALIPLLALEPGLIHPVTGIPLQESLNKLGENEEVVREQGMRLFPKTLN